MSPGQTLTVTVAATGSFQTVAVVGETPIGFSTPLPAPPYQFSIQVPAGIRLGQYRLTAIGAATPGQPTTSSPITIDVERSDSPSSVIVQPSVLNFRLPGDQCPLRVIGTFSGGAQVDVTESTGTSYTMYANTNIASVNGSGMVTANSPGETNIYAVYEGWYAPVHVTVKQPVAVVPPDAQLYPSGSQQFVAQVTNASGNNAVTWSASPSGVGTLSSTGLYTAPASISAQQMLTVTATSVDDPTKTGPAVLWLYPPISVGIAPNAASLGPSQTKQFTASVSNVRNIAAWWSISPAGVGAIDNNGNYTAPSTISSAQTVTVTATSAADPTKTATATISLNPPTPITVTAAPNTKTYDGNTSAAAIPTITSGSLASGDTANFTEAYTDKLVGTAKTLAPTGNVKNAAGGDDTANYAITFVNSTAGVISAKALTVTGVTAANKVYDGTTSAALTTGAAALVGVVSGDSVALSTSGATGAFTTSSVGANIPVSVSGLSISGGDSGNYSLTQPSPTAHVNSTLTLYVSIQSQGVVYVYWRAYSAGSPAANSYQVCWGLASDMSNSTCATTTINPGNGTNPYVVSGLTSGATYYFQITPLFSGSAIAGAFTPIASAVPN